jgi:hypothetical protein
LATKAGRGERHDLRFAEAQLQQPWRQLGGELSTKVVFPKRSQVVVLQNQGQEVDSQVVGETVMRQFGATNPALFYENEPISSHIWVRFGESEPILGAFRVAEGSLLMYEFSSAKAPRVAWKERNSDEQTTGTCCGQEPRED